MTDEPEPPVNVRLVDADGNEHAVSLAFAGYSTEGVARWYVVDAAPGPWRAMRADTIPARSEIIFPLDLP